MRTTRDEAASVVAEVSARLTDPEQVVATTLARGPYIELHDGNRMGLWGPLSLGGGYPAVALLFAELAHTHQALRSVAHRYLQRAADIPTDEPPNGLFGGLGSLAFAANAARQSDSAYASSLAVLDDLMAASATRIVRAEQQRMDAASGATAFDCYDVIGGLAGTGRYLLHRSEQLRPALHEVLTYLVRLSQPITVGGTEVPGWWVGHSPTMEGEVDEWAEGHLNLGLAHGIAGPLALLALAATAGERVPGQDEAVTRMADWLLEQGREDEFGVYWPGVLPVSTWSTTDVERPSWCYGTPGIARALQLAGQALGRRDWVEAAHGSVLAMLDRPERTWQIVDPFLCHGWAGTAHLLRRLNEDFEDERIAHAVDTMACRILELYRPDAPFGFHWYYHGTPYDLPGFLDGAAGVLLALHGYAAATAPASEWDSALLVA